MSDELKLWLDLGSDISAEEFARRYPFPFLVSEGTVSAPAQKSFKTIVGSGQGESSDPELKPPRVWPVVKSERNRFPHMITVGRADNNDVVLEPLSVSKFHAYFSIDAKRMEYSITDAESKFGTTVSDKKIPTSSPRLLSSGDQILFGKEAKLTFYKNEEFYSYMKLLRGMSNR